MNPGFGSKGINDDEETYELDKKISLELGIYLLLFYVRTSIAY